MFLILHNVFLQSNSILEYATLLAAFAAVIGVIVSIYFNKRAQDHSAEAQFSTVLNDSIREFSRLFDREGSLKNTNDCELYSIAYLDILDGLAFLSINKKIPEDIAQYFKEYYSYGWLVIKWYNKKVRSKKLSAEQRWPNIKQWCDDKNIEADEDISYLPEIMENDLSNLSKNE